MYKVNYTISKSMNELIDRQRDHKEITLSSQEIYKNLNMYFDSWAGTINRKQFTKFDRSELNDKCSSMVEIKLAHKQIISHLSGIGAGATLRQNPSTWSVFATFTKFNILVSDKGELNLNNVRWRSTFQIGII